MERDIEEIRVKIEEFMRRYGVGVKVETICEGRDIRTGKIVNAKAHLIIMS